MQQYTSLPLSKWLHEKGFRGESELYWISVHGAGTNKAKLYNKEEAKMYNDIYFNVYPAYDLLWDICIKYGKEIFGEEWKSDDYGKSGHSADVFELLETGRVEEAEQYIKDNSIL